MSQKKYKKKGHQKSIPWSLAIFGGILFIIVAFAFANRNGDGGGTPTISVDQQKIDYGDVKFNTPETFTIKVTNTGTGTLRFKEAPYIEVLEGC